MPLFNHFVVGTRLKEESENWRMETCFLIARAKSKEKENLQLVVDAYKNSKAMLHFDRCQKIVSSVGQSYNNIR